MNYLYVVRENSLWGIPTLKHKVGITNRPRKRLKQLQTGNAERLVFVSVMRIGSRSRARRVEAKIHRWLALLHIAGEWFLFPPFISLKPLIWIAKWTTL